MFLCSLYVFVKGYSFCFPVTLDLFVRGPQKNINKRKGKIIATAPISMDGKAEFERILDGGS